MQHPALALDGEEEFAGHVSLSGSMLSTSNGMCDFVLLTVLLRPFWLRCDLRQYQVKAK